MFSIIVAADKNNGIGKNNSLPWNLKTDMKYFKEVTTKTTLQTEKNVVVMGKNTWFSIPEKYRPLPNRLNVVLSKNRSLIIPHAVVLTGLDAAIDYVKGCPDLDKIFVIGGAHLYKEAFTHPDCYEILMTRIDNHFDCDVFIPEIPNDFQLVSSESQEENDINFSFETYRKINCCM